jgi:hypothetical protein
MRRRRPPPRSSTRIADTAPVINAVGAAQGWSRLGPRSAPRRSIARRSSGPDSRARRPISSGRTDRTGRAAAPRPDQARRHQAPPLSGRRTRRSERRGAREPPRPHPPAPTQGRSFRAEPERPARVIAQPRTPGPTQARGLPSRASLDHVHPVGHDSSRGRPSAPRSPPLFRARDHVHWHAPRAPMDAAARSAVGVPPRRPSAAVLHRASPRATARHPEDRAHGTVVDSVNVKVLLYVPVRRASVAAIVCSNSSATESSATGAG